MSSTTTQTPYMSLTLPIPGIEQGPQYAFDQNSAFTIIDQHTHIPGQGLAIPTAGININADFPINSFNLTLIRSSRYVNQISPLSLVSDINCTYVSGGELFYNDVLGNQVQITLGGAVDSSGSGNITGMGGTGASVVYTNINKTFSFYQSANRPTALSIGTIAIGNNQAAPNQITLTTSNAIAAPYTMTFPDTLPASQSFITVNNGGIQTNVAPDNTTTSIVSNQLVANFPVGMIAPFAGTGTGPAGWLLCDGGTPSRTTFAALFAIIGTAYGIGDGITTFNVPDLRGMFLRGVSGASGNDPDAAARTATNGGNAGNAVGSKQGDKFSSHNHGITDPGHNHTQNGHGHTLTTNPHTHAPMDIYTGVSNQAAGSGANLSEILTGDVLSAPVHNQQVYVTAPNTTVTGVADGITATNNPNTTGVTTNVTGGNENRPLNVYVNFLIKT